MTIQELQTITIRLGNNGFVRWWAHYNYPQSEPWLIAIAVQGQPSELYPLSCELMEEGFSTLEDPRKRYMIYTIPRTDENGQPFKSTL